MPTHTSHGCDVEEFADRILSKTVKAGRRTYFFDVRATRGNDYFLTITESRKKTDGKGFVDYDRHKIFLYKEDFEKFANGFSEAVEFIKQNKPEFFECHNSPQNVREKSIDEEFDEL